jgi:hypothetical protein
MPSHQATDSRSDVTICKLLQKPPRSFCAVAAAIILLREIAMSLEISAELEAQLLQNARAQGLELEDYLCWLMAEEQAEFISAIEEGCVIQSPAGFDPRGRRSPISVQSLAFDAQLSHAVLHDQRAAIMKDRRWVSTRSLGQG